MADKEIVLVGGGHAHVLVLKAFGMTPEPGARLTIVAKELAAPYSGMLPGFVAGHYTERQIHIDVPRLAGFARARIVNGTAYAIDRAAKRILIHNAEPLVYDLLSIDVGITPDLSEIKGAREHIIAVKPVSAFAPKWTALEQHALRPDGPRRIAVVGGGAAGIELLLAARHRLLTRTPHQSHSGQDFSFVLVAGTRILASHAPRAQTLARRSLLEAGVTIIEDDPVVAASASELTLASGRGVPADAVLASTKAAPAQWLQNSGLPLSPAGFLAVRPTLQLLDDDHVFACGDCADVLEHPRPKSGVFAVRQGPPLTENLRRVVRGQAAMPFTPQTDFLTLISLGDKRAIAARGTLAASGRWAWLWKDAIDRAFMRQFDV